MSQQKISIEDTKKPSAGKIIWAIIASVVFSFVLYVLIMSLLSFVSGGVMSDIMRRSLFFVVLLLFVFGPGILAAAVLLPIIRKNKR